MKQEMIWAKLGEQEHFLQSVPEWVAKLLRQPYAQAIKLPVFENPLQEGCVYRPGFEEKFQDRTYLAFLEEQIRLKPRGESWAQILKRRLDALSPYCERRLYHVNFRRFSGGLIQSCKVALDPEALSIVFWESD